MVVEGVGRDGEEGEEVERFFFGSEAGLRGEEERGCLVSWEGIGMATRRGGNGLGGRDRWEAMFWGRRRREGGYGAGGEMMLSCSRMD